MNKRQLTLNYTKAFNDKNIDAVLALVDDEIYLKDPSNEIFGKEQLRGFLKDFFKNDISFSAREVISDDETTNLAHSMIHFTLRVNDEIFNGADIIKWKDGKIISLIAYL
jgi:ketosteroid isomerase-like protein